MVIPEGYKKTEVGIIPEDWDIIDFEQVGVYFKGKGISMRDVKLYGKPCIMYGDIYVKFDTHFYDCDYYVDDITASKSIRALPQDLFFTASGETAEDIGRCVSYLGKDAIYIGGDIIALRPHNQYDSLFLSYVQNSHSLKRQKAALAQGNSVVHISTSNIQKTIFACPRKKQEQINISSVLYDVDNTIDNLEKLVEKKKNIKQGAMQELLTGKRRLPGFDGEWTVKFIGKSGHLCKETVNPQLSSLVLFCEYSMPAFDKGKKPIMRYGSEMHSNRTVISGKVLLFNKLNVRQKRIWLINAEKEKSVCSSEFLAYYSDQIDLLYLNYLLNTNEVTKDFIDSSSGTSNSQQRITPDAFLGYSITVPSDIEEQTAIASILSDMDNEIEELEKKLAKYRYLKQGMMSELLSGHIRLTEKESA